MADNPRETTRVLWFIWHSEGRTHHEGSSHSGRHGWVEGLYVLCVRYRKSDATCVLCVRYRKNEWRCVVLWKPERYNSVCEVLKSLIGVCCIGESNGKAGGYVMGYGKVEGYLMLQSNCD